MHTKTGNSITNPPPPKQKSQTPPAQLKSLLVIRQEQYLPLAIAAVANAQR